MLKALELHGFKSFADRTRFAFDPGITVVVGPNGSGKSNVVDAIKWALGSQSAKSLRGKEMSDVIFSGSSSRRAANAAEVSLTFDNATGLFDLDAPDVELTRRVYRSGEVEYLVNRQPRRLRDLRDLLTGAGLTTSAYCVIEQGKVDALLQSSPKQRRLLFEEAAGVSRFKIKREEAARRLERVQQNLLRLTDLVDELEGRLRTVRTQAGKARKYAELAERLKRLRTTVTLVDYRELSQRIERLGVSDHADQDRVDELERQLAACDESVAQIDAAAAAGQQRLRHSLAEVAAIREKIAHCLATRSSQLARIDELTIESERIARQVLWMSTRAGDSQQLVDGSLAEASAARDEFARLQQQVEEGLAEISQLESEHDRASQQEDEARTQWDVAVRESARQNNLIEVLAARLESSRSTVARCREQEMPLQQNAQRLREQRRVAQDRLQQAAAQLDQAQRGLQQARERVAASRRRHAALQHDAADAQRQLAAARERAAVLEELERRLDGLTAGAREVLRCASEDPQGPFGEVRGVVADLLEVDADSASMIEVALGERAGYLVVNNAQRLCEELGKTSRQWPGRVCFLRLDAPAPASAVDRVDLSDEPGVMGRADHFVETIPDLAGLARRLLGRYWLVDSLATAFRLSADCGRGLSYVTAAGEVVALDGALIVGPQQSATGLLSRRSELRNLGQRLEAMREATETREQECDALKTAIAADETQVERLAAETSDLQQAASECRLTAAAASQRVDEIELQVEGVMAERIAAEQAAEQFENQRHEARSRLEFAELQHQRLELLIQEAGAARAEAAARLTLLRREVTDQRVALAGADQRREGLQRQIDQLLCDRQEREQSLQEMRQRAAECRILRQELLSSVLARSAESAELYRSKDLLAAELYKLAAHEQLGRDERGAAVSAADALRERLLQQQRQLQKSQLQFQQIEHQRTALAERLFEDYQADLEQLAQTPDHPLLLAEIPERAAADREIADLKERLQNVGPVNLEALEELEQLEHRWQTLASQHDDLQNAQQRLAQLVAQINGESRQLFAATLDEVRGHFQGIFTTLFGGGDADIVIEDDEQGDILECGVNIVARPPGKQPRSISLLSGGERTLTCVALLLAVFKSRPSPFCVLDEVDAALDEANIDRFVKVIKEFMHSTQFVVITHSKRTMSCSDTLYGVTMQESGVSKRVSVRFEDVSADGRIRADAARAA